MAFFGDIFEMCVLKFNKEKQKIQSYKNGKASAVHLASTFFLLFIYATAFFFLWLWRVSRMTSPKDGVATSKWLILIAIAWINLLGGLA